MNSVLVKKMQMILGYSMRNNYFKIKIPLINKNYFAYEQGDKGKYKYHGIAYILIEKATGNIAYNTLILNESQTIYGADDGKYGNDYGIKKKSPELFEYRKTSFNHSIPEGRSKNVSKFKHEVSELNELILKHRLTIKDVDAFISGSNPSGGLKKPDADPVRIYFGKEDPLLELFNVEATNVQWKFFSLISNLKGKFNNANFNDEVTQLYLESIEEKPISYIFDELDWKFIPYKEAGYEDLYVDFKDAFKAQNAELFDITKEDISLSATSDNFFNSMNYIEHIINLSNRGDKRFLNKEVRSIWRRIVDQDINSNKYDKDFVKGLSLYDRAHIIENRSASNILLNSTIDIDYKKDFLKELFNPNNYILLTKDIHTYWDQNLIAIEESGEIINISLSDEEFNQLTREHTNIFSIYNNVLNSERKRLIEERDLYNSY